MTRPPGLLVDMLVIRPPAETRQVLRLVGLEWTARREFEAMGRPLKRQATGKQPSLVGWVVCRALSS